MIFKNRHYQMVSKTRIVIKILEEMGTQMKWYVHSVYFFYQTISIFVCEK